MDALTSPVTTRAALLQVLRLGEGFGLDLIERVETLTGGRIVLWEGAIYTALHNLEGEGLVVHVPGKSRRGGRPRRYYRLTTQGRKVSHEHGSAIRRLFHYSVRKMEVALQYAKQERKEACLSG